MKRRHWWKWWSVCVCECLCVCVCIGGRWEEIHAGKKIIPELLKLQKKHLLWVDQLSKNFFLHRANYPKCKFSKLAMCLSPDNQFTFCPSAVQCTYEHLYAASPRNSILFLKLKIWICLSGKYIDSQLEGNNVYLK